jgi:hypothetical protein
MLDHPLIIAHMRARQVVGDRVWAKLSERVRIGAVKEELRALGADPEMEERLFLAVINCWPPAAAEERNQTLPQTPNRRAQE